MGKGSGRRPRNISLQQEAENWEAIFGKKQPNPDADEMGRARYKPDPQTGKMIPDYMWAQYGIKDDEPNKGHFIIRDSHYEYLSPISGKPISGKRAHRYDLHSNGCRVYEGRGSEQRAADSHLKQEDQKLDRELEKSMAKTLNDIKYQNNAPSGDKISWTW